MRAMVRRTLVGLSAMGLLLAAACDPGMDEVPGAARPATAPLTGKADGADSADRSCQIVLRSVGRQPGGSDYQTECVDGVCSYLWAGTVELAEGLDQVTVHVLYRQAGDPRWWEVTATPAQNSQPGFRAYSFALFEHLFGPGATSSEQDAARIELIPFYRTADGGRVFDHNVATGDGENIVLSRANNFAHGGSAACKPLFGRLSFFGSWEEHQSGALHQGGYLVVDYDLSRLPNCRNSHNGAPAWDTLAHVKFIPSGVMVKGSVRRFKTANGVPTSEVEKAPLTVKIPEGATAVELWFENASGAGSTCRQWDSNYGKNYRYAIWPAPDDPRCKGIERTDTKYGGTPLCLDYTVDAHHAATHCELYLDGIGDGYEGHYGIPFNWVEAYLKVAPQQGTLLGAGMLTLYRDRKGGPQKVRTTFGQQLDGRTFRTSFTYLHTAVQGGGSYAYTVDALAFFVDVRRPDGQVVRLWQSRGGQNYAWNDAFGHGTIQKSIPYGRMTWAGDAAPIFDQRNRCR